MVFKLAGYMACLSRSAQISRGEHEATVLMNRRVLPLHADPQLQAYVVGVAIGDGNLSNPNGRAVRLRITCDKKYPALIARIRAA